MTKSAEINAYLNCVNERERARNGLTPHYNFAVVDIARKYIIAKIDSYYYLYEDMPALIYDLIYTRNQKQGGSYINFARKINDLKVF